MIHDSKNYDDLDQRWHWYYDDDAPLDEYERICTNAGGRYKFFEGSYFCKGNIKYDWDTGKEMTTKGTRMVKPFQLAVCLPPANVTYKIHWDDEDVIQCDETCTAEYTILNDPVAPLHWKKCGTEKSSDDQKEIKSFIPIALFVLVVVVGVIGWIVYFRKVQQQPSSESTDMAAPLNVQDLDEEEEANAGEDLEEEEVVEEEEEEEEDGAVDERTQLNPVEWERLTYKKKKGGAGETDFHETASHRFLWGFYSISNAIYIY